MTVTTASRPISMHARGRVAGLMSRLTGEAEATMAAWKSLPLSVVKDAALKGKVGSERAVDRILRHMPIAPIWRERHRMIFRLLVPYEGLPGATAESPPTDRQQMVVVRALWVNRGNGPRKGRSPFGMATTAHAIARLFDRSEFEADPVAAMLMAHTALLTIPPAEGEQIFALPSVTLPAGAGAFLATPRELADGSPMAVARTWVPVEMTHPDQDAELAAWARLMSVSSDDEPS